MQLRHNSPLESINVSNSHLPPCSRRGHLILVSACCAHCLLGEIQTPFFPVTLASGLEVDSIRSSRRLVRIRTAKRVKTLQQFAKFPCNFERRLCHVFDDDDRGPLTKAGQPNNSTNGTCFIGLFRRKQNPRPGFNHASATRKAKREMRYNYISETQLRTQNTPL